MRVAAARRNGHVVTAAARLKKIFFFLLRIQKSALSGKIGRTDKGCLKSYETRTFSTRKSLCSVYPDRGF